MQTKIPSPQELQQFFMATSNKTTAPTTKVSVCKHVWEDDHEAGWERCTLCSKREHVVQSCKKGEHKWMIKFGRQVCTVCCLPRDSTPDACKHVWVAHAVHVARDGCTACPATRATPKYAMEERAKVEALTAVEMIAGAILPDMPPRPETPEPPSDDESGSPTSTATSFVESAAAADGLSLTKAEKKRLAKTLTELGTVPEDKTKSKKTVAAKQANDAGPSVSSSRKRSAPSGGVLATEYVDFSLLSLGEIIAVRPQDLKLDGARAALVAMREHIINLGEITRYYAVGQPTLAAKLFDTHYNPSAKHRRVATVSAFFASK